MNSSLLKVATTIAEKSIYKQRIGAVIFNKNAILSTGYNKISTWSCKLHPRFKRWPTSIHAEAAAILNARMNLKGCSIIVCRINPSGEYRLAKPCYHCQLYLNYLGIIKVYYTIPTEPYYDFIKLIYSIEHKRLIKGIK